MTTHCSGILPEGLMEAFWRYEHALAADDLDELDALFAPGAETLRADAEGVLVGHTNISEFRARRRGAPQRDVLAVHVRPTGTDQALVIAETSLKRGGRGLQTQLWGRNASGTWTVAAAHVSVSSPAIDSRIWRIAGDPLIRPLGRGPLDGLSVAVKDLFAVAGQPVGAGNPTWLDTAPVESSHAWSVATLLGAGARVRGIARTDEFAYSLAGTNSHYGTPPNPGAPGRISGGSTSGPAAAVSLGQADIALGTDTGGSIRIPAAYQGLWGIRTTHGAITTSGVLPLAPTFDTVGWLTRDAATLRAVGRVLLPDTSIRTARELVLPAALTDLADPGVAEVVRSAATSWGAAVDTEPLTELQEWKRTFITRQSVEAWQSHGWWLRTRMDSLGADVRGRFELASTRTADEAVDSAEAVARARAAIIELIGERIWVIPAAPTVAPRIGDDLELIRNANLSMTCVAGLGGLPVVCVPRVTADGLPCAVALMAAPGRDLDLLDLAASLP